MTQAAVQNPPEAPAAEQVTIELGPDTKLYPERMVQTEPTIPEPAAPESEEAGTSEASEADAGPSQEPQTGSRRQKGEDAYQRGLREGRENAARERDEAQARQAREQAQQQEQQRIRQLYRDLKSNDYDTRERASQALGDLADMTELQATHRMAGRSEVLAEMGQSINAIKDLEGMDEDGFKEIWNSKTPADAVKVAFARGQKLAKTQADERIAELEAQLEAANGRGAARSLTPDRQNGSSGKGPGLTLEQYQRMSPRQIKAAGITSADIDAMVAEMQAEAQRNGR